MKTKKKKKKQRDINMTYTMVSSSQIFDIDQVISLTFNISKK
jgi:hypothetical protein